MQNHHGDFIWYELFTLDVEAAARFYGPILGWKLKDTESMRGYRLFVTRDGFEVAGVLELSPEACENGAKPGWLGYIGVEDVDAAVQEVLKRGGTQHMQAMEVPGVGRFAFLGDPQGAPFYVMRGAVDEVSRSFAPNLAGRCQWHELATSDQKAALEFYGGCFGWTKGDAMPMGEQGDYQFFLQRGEAIGAVMSRAPGGAPPAWLFYFGVEDIDEAARRIESVGAKILHGPGEIPTGSFILVAEDLEGAAVGFVGPRRA